MSLSRLLRLLCPGGHGAWEVCQARAEDQKGCTVGGYPHSPVKPQRASEAEQRGLRDRKSWEESGEWCLHLSSGRYNSSSPTGPWGVRKSTRLSTVRGAWPASLEGLPPPGSQQPPHALPHGLLTCPVRQPLQSRLLHCPSPEGPFTSR